MATFLPEMDILEFQDSLWKGKDSSKVGSSRTDDGPMNMREWESAESGAGIPDSIPDFEIRIQIRIFRTAVQTRVQFKPRGSSMTSIYHPKKHSCWSNLAFIFRLRPKKMQDLWTKLGLLYMLIHLGGKIRYYCQSKHPRQRRLNADPQQHVLYKNHYIRNAQGMWLFSTSSF